MIAVAGLLQFKPEDRQAVLDGLKEVVRRSRQDPGCIDYWWSEDIETADAFRFFECWESQELMDAHMAQPHTEDFMSRCVSRVTNVDAYAYQVSDRQSAAG
ncbi:MAG: putative quinol monooxygenase [Acidimicrobiales bacterium]